jgi:hypothetical protein
MKTYTHFSATIHLPGHYFPLVGPITETQLLTLANNGTTPRAATLALTAEAERIRAGLLAGNTVATKTATIRPLTAEEYARTH